MIETGWNSFGTYSPSCKILLLFFVNLWLASVNKSLQKTPPKKRKKIYCQSRRIWKKKNSKEDSVITWRVKRSADWPTTLSYFKPSAASPAIATTANLRLAITVNLFCTSHIYTIQQVMNLYAGNFVPLPFSAISVGGS